MKKLVCFSLVFLVLFISIVPVLAVDENSSNSADLVEPSSVNLLEGAKVSASVVSRGESFDLPLDKGVFNDLYSWLYYKQTLNVNRSWNECQKITYNFELSSVAYIDHFYSFLRYGSADNYKVYVNGTLVTTGFSGYNNFYSLYSIFSATYVKTISFEFNSGGSNFVVQPIVLSCFGSDSVVLRPDTDLLWSYMDTYAWVDPQHEDSGIDNEFSGLLSGSIDTVGTVTVSNNTWHRLNQKRIRICVDISSLKSDCIDNFFLNFVSVGEVLEATAFLSDFPIDSGEGNSYGNPNSSADNSMVNALNSRLTPYTLLQQSPTQYFGYYEWPVSGYQYCIDMSTADARSKYLNISIVVEALDGGDSGEDSCAFFGADDLFYTINLTTDSFKSSLLSYLETIQVYLDSGLLTFQDFYNDWLNYISLDPEDYEKVEDIQGIIDSQADNIKDQLAALEDIDKPSIDLNSYFADINPDNSVFDWFKGLLSNGYVFSLLMTLFAIGFVSFLLFGGK